MSYRISAIVTSFKYTGALPHRYLVSDFVLLPLSRSTTGFKGYAEAPFDQLTPAIKRYARELSFAGRCAFVEADFFGGSGDQAGIVWEDGRAVWGPLETRHPARSSDDHEGSVGNGAINQALRAIGVRRHEGKDEFDTVGLGCHRSNREWLKEIATRKPGARAERARPHVGAGQRPTSA